VIVRKIKNIKLNQMN